jgi:hypothetical protein
MGWSGVMLAVFGVAMMGWHPILAVYGVLHLIVVVGLTGDALAAKYEKQAAWREKYKLGEPGAERVGRAVVRAGASLPSIVLWALAPREEPGSLLAVGAAVLAVAGLTGVLRLRSWGALAMGVAGAVALAQGGVLQTMSPAVHGWTAPFALPVVMPGLLLLAFVPFARPIANYLLRK